MPSAGTAGRSGPWASSATPSRAPAPSRAKRWSSSNGRASRPSRPSSTTRATRTSTRCARTARATTCGGRTSSSRTSARCSAVDARARKGDLMRINLTSILVDDQDKALRFYTGVLGFRKKTEVPLGEHRWLTVVAPDDPDGVELVLEPDEHPAAGPFKAALMEDGIPFTSFAVDDVQREFERLSAAGVRFTQPPTDMGPVTTAVLDDTCGNLIQIAATG